MRQSTYGIQPMPASPRTSRSRDGARARPEKIMEARMFAMFTWNCVMLVANAARATAARRGRVGQRRARGITADEHDLADVIGT